jgi:hypothetical protein
MKKKKIFALCFFFSGNSNLSFYMDRSLFDMKYYFRLIDKDQGKKEILSHIDIDLHSRKNSSVQNIKAVL